MKFTDGYWLTREGLTIYYPTEIRDSKTEGKSITLYAPCKAIHHRGATLGDPLFTINYSSPIPNVIRVKVAHFLGKKDKGPRFGVYTDSETKTDIVDAADEISLTSDRLQVRIQKNKGWNIDYLYKGKRLTGNLPRSTGYVVAQDKNTFLREQLDLGIGEVVYGLGERFTPFSKNGQSIDIWNEDGGTCSEQAYKNIPFYITNRGYGVLVNHPERVSFEVGSENVSKVQFSVPGETLEYYIIGGDTLGEVLENYTSLTGKPALPPAWSFGLWLTTSFTTSYDEATVTGFIHGMKERDIPLSVFHFDCFWMKEFQWCDFQWDKEVFPDPEEMLKRLKDKELKICVWINPYIAQKSPLFDEGMEKGYLLKTKEGDVWQWDRWQSGMGLVDFTNPSAVEWFKGKLRQLMDMGVDCFKTDFGERIPTDVVYFDGSDPLKMHNYYTYLYNKTVFEVQEEARGRNEAVLFARSATVGCQKFPVHWGGDCSSTYASMAETLRGGLSLGLSGFGFWSHDISGFENTASPDIYKRWTAFGLLSSHSRLHGNSSYRVPWFFDEEAVEVLRFFTKLKCKLMPYLYKGACEASQKGIPLMRAMVLEYSEDPACSYLDRQYMLGESLLVAPVFSEDATVSYYLPKGTWTNFLTNEMLEGGTWREEKHDYLSLPLWIRPNSIIAIGSEDSRPDYDYADQVTFHAFQIEDGKTVSTKVFNTAGKAEMEVSIRRMGNKLTIEANGNEKPWSILLRNIFDVKAVKEGAFLVESLGTKIIPNEKAKSGKIVSDVWI